MRQRTAAAVSAVPRIAPIRLAQNKLSLIRDLAGALQSALVPLACIVFATGYCFDDLYVALLGTVLMFTANIVFGCLRLRERLLFLFLHAGIALFLLTRPVIGTLDECIAPGCFRLLKAHGLPSPPSSCPWCFFSWGP